MHHTVRTYKEMDRWARAFTSGAFGLFFLIGPQGQAKTTTLRKLMAYEAAKPAKQPKNKGKAPAFKGPQNPDRIEEPLWVEGGAVSAFKLYQLLWDHQHQTIIIDDVDSVYTDRLLIRLLKALCQTEAEKAVGWHTNNKQLETSGIPSKFWTTSRVCIIANRWKNLNEHVGSLTDRGMMVLFRPSPKEVFDYVKREKICLDREILKFVGDHLWMVNQLSIRVFVVAMEAKRHHLEWKSAIAEELGIYKMMLVQKLMADNSFRTTEERATAFQKATGLSRPLYFEAVQALKEAIATKKGKVRV
jgi:hypothetical protein